MLKICITHFIFSLFFRMGQQNIVYILQIIFVIRDLI